MDRVHHQCALHGDEAADAGIGALQFLHDQAVLDVAHPGAPVPFEVSAQKAQIGHLGDQFGGKPGLAIAVPDQGQNPLFGEAPGGLPHHQLFGVEQRVDAEIVYTSKSHVKFYI